MKLGKGQKSAIGERVRLAREKKSLTQAQLASMVRRTQPWLVGIEKGRDLGLRAVREIADALGIEYREFISGILTPEQQDKELIAREDVKPYGSPSARVRAADQLVVESRKHPKNFRRMVKLAIEALPPEILTEKAMTILDDPELSDEDKVEFGKMLRDEINRRYPKKGE